MEFTNEFVVPTDTTEAWSVLTDVPRIVPCLPGASAEPLGDNAYSGTVAVKVGPIKVSYAGTASFRDLDADALRMVLDAEGKEKSGKGSASAAVTVTLHAEGTAETRVLVHTSLTVTGKLAQFGRSAMADVGGRLIAQFAGNLEKLLAPERQGASTAAGTPIQSGPPQGGATASLPAAAPAPGAELDALALIAPLAKRLLPSVVGFGLGVLFSQLAARRTPRMPARRVAPFECGPS